MGSGTYSKWKDTMNIKMIIGLGNPGAKYAGTRHNIGFDAVTAISDRFDIPVKTKEWKGLTGKGRIGGCRVLLVQPQTFMNNSGECVRALMDFYKIPAEDVIILYDDVSLAPGKLRVRGKGSAGGHNGIKSIIAHMGTDTFERVRIGVGEKPEGWDLADYVLGRFPKEEEPVMRDALKHAVEAVESLIEDGLEATMNRFNGNLM